jgi:hypothetical protein
VIAAFDSQRPLHDALRQIGEHAFGPEQLDAVGLDLRCVINLSISSSSITDRSPRFLADMSRFLPGPQAVRFPPLHTVLYTPGVSVPPYERCSPTTDLSTSRRRSPARSRQSSCVTDGSRSGRRTTTRCANDSKAPCYRNAGGVRSTAGRSPTSDNSTRGRRVADPLQHATSKPQRLHAPPHTTRDPRHPPQEQDSMTINQMTTRHLNPARGSRGRPRRSRLGFRRWAGCVETV